MDRFEINQVVMSLYIDSAQIYLELSIGALALSIIFKEKIIGESGPVKVSIILALSWLLYLLTIGASAFYQYLAVKFLDSISPYPGPIQYFEALVRSPGKVYGAMLVFFFTASILLVASSAMQLFARNRGSG